MRWNRLFWAFALSLLPITLLFLGGLSSLQTAAIVGGLPLLVICVLLMMSIVRVAYLDLFFQEDYEDSVINISGFPDYDPWSTEGMALAKFEQLKDQVIDIIAEESELKNEIKDIQKEMRAEALLSSKAGIYDDTVLTELRARLDEVVAQLDAKTLEKQDKLQEAKDAKTTFDELVEKLRQEEIQ